MNIPSRRRFVAGSLAAIAAYSLPRTTSAQSPKLATVPTVDTLVIKVLTDSSYDTPRAGSSKWVKVKRASYISTTNFRKALHNEWGLALALESRVGNDTRNLLLDYGYTPEALINNMEMMSVDPSKVQAMILSHGHFDHFGTATSFPPI